MAAATLLSPRLRESFSRAAPLRMAVRGLRRAHSGVVCDYVVWLALGLAVLGGLSAALFRG